MESMINVNPGATDRTKDIAALSEAIVNIMNVGSDREVTTQALRVLEAGTHIITQISSCTFTNRIEGV